MEETEAKECIVTCYCRGTKWSIVNQEIQNLEIMKSVVKNSHFGEVSVTYDLYEIHIFLSKSGWRGQVQWEKTCESSLCSPLDVSGAWRVLWFAAIVL